MYNIFSTKEIRVLKGGVLDAYGKTDVNI